MTKTKTAKKVQKCSKCGRVNAKNPAAHPNCFVPSACRRRQREAK